MIVALWVTSSTRFLEAWYNSCGDLGLLGGASQPSGARLPRHSGRVHPDCFSSSLRLGPQSGRISAGLAQATCAGQLLSQRSERAAHASARNKLKRAQKRPPTIKSVRRLAMRVLTNTGGATAAGGIHACRRIPATRLDIRLRSTLTGSRNWPMPQTRNYGAPLSAAREPPILWAGAAGPCGFRDGAEAVRSAQH